MLRPWKGALCCALFVVAGLGWQADIAAQERPNILRGNAIRAAVTGATDETVDVYVNDVQVNAFVRFQPDYLELTLPFTDATGKYRLVIRDRASGEERLKRDFVTAESALFDTTSATMSFQDDVVYQAARKRHKAHDFRFTGSFEGVRGSLSSKLDIEVLGTNDNQKKLNPDGPHVDVSNGLLTLTQRGTDGLIQGFLGDVQINGGLDLVNQGYGSRGFSLTGQFLNDRLRVNGGNAYGVDVKGVDHSFVNYESQNRRGAVNVELDLVKSQLVNLTTIASVLDVRRPGENGFGIGDVPDGETNFAYGGGVRLGLAEDRVRATAQYARSRYDNPTNLNVLNEFGGSTDVGATEDNAGKLRIEADVLRTETVTVGVHGHYERVGALFRSVQSGALSDRETHGYGISLGYDILTLSYTLISFRNNVDDIPGILTTRNETGTTRAEISLDQYRQKGLKDMTSGRFVPSTISLSYADTKIQALNADTVVLFSSLDGSEIPDQRTHALTAGATWAWSFGQTGLDISRSLLDNRQIGRESADTDDTSVNVSQSFNLANTTADVRLGYGRFKNKDSATKSTNNRWEFGLGFQASLKGLPDFNASFDWNRSETSLIAEGGNSLTKSWRFGTGLNFAKFMTEWLPYGTPYFRISFNVQETEQDSTTFPVDDSFNYILSFAGGFKF